MIRVLIGCYAVVTLVLLTLVFMGVGQAHGEASWIMMNPATSWCCGPEDCAALSSDEVSATPEGVVVKATKETIPYRDLKQSIDGRWWRCRRPDGTTRCLFMPPYGS